MSEGFVTLGFMPGINVGGSARGVKKSGFPPDDSFDLFFCLRTVTIGFEGLITTFGDFDGTSVCLFGTFVGIPNSVIVSADVDKDLVVSTFGVDTDSVSVGLLVLLISANVDFEVDV